MPEAGQRRRERAERAGSGRPTVFSHEAASTVTLFIARTARATAASTCSARARPAAAAAAAVAAVAAAATACVDHGNAGTPLATPLRAHDAIGLDRVIADTCRRIADTSAVTLVQSRAGDRGFPHAYARLAGVGLRAGVAVVAGIAGEQRAATVLGGTGRDGAPIARTSVARCVTADTIHTETALAIRRQRAVAAERVQGV